ncbi:MAG: hypothetical protein PHU51_03410 [Candidatus Nanoarchaeia archaeon]|nr:hypothetical protein [Candidatus Nanoarchaeia archaeon]
MNKKMRYLSKEERKHHRTKRLMSWILVGIMVFSIFSIWATSYMSSERIQFNEYKFKYSNDEKYGDNTVLTTKVDGKELFFYTHPEDAMQIPVEGNLTNLLFNKNYYIFTTNPTTDAGYLSDLIRYEFSTLLEKEFYIGVDDIYEDFPDIPVITCENASLELPVLYLIQTEEPTNITIQNNCATINLNLKEAAYLRDRLLLSMTGISNR